MIDIHFSPFFGTTATDFGCQVPCEVPLFMNLLEDLFPKALFKHLSGITYRKP
jgi:hypothetical protein